MLIRNKRARTLARSVPGLVPVYRVLLRRYLLTRGRATLDYPGARIELRTASDEVIGLRLRPVAKEPWTVEWIEANLQPGDVLYDIGANVGDYALIAAAVGGLRVQVVAIEPAYASYAELCENVLLNDVAATVLPLPVLLGERTSLDVLALRSTDAGAADHGAVAGQGYRQPVLGATLDDLVQRFGAPQPTLIKLDVDGAEASVLAGAQSTLESPALRSLVIEIEASQTDAVLERMQGAGFELTRRIDDRYGEPLPGVWYGIFDRPKH